MTHRWPRHDIDIGQDMVIDIGQDMVIDIGQNNSCK